MWKELQYNFLRGYIASKLSVTLFRTKHAHVTISQEKALHARYAKFAHTMNKMQFNEAGGATAHEGPSMGTVRRPGRGNEQMTHLWEAGRGSTSSWAR